jgi:hypothetical protein
MAASTPIARLVESMLADGFDRDAIVRAVERSEKKLAATKTSGSRGMRLSNDWTPSQGCISYAEKLGMEPNEIALEAEKFKNYWTAKSGAGASKRDWDATWRNWILNSMERRNAFASHHHGRSSRTNSGARHGSAGADAILAGMGRLAHRLTQDPGGPRQTDRPLARSPDTATIIAAKGERT